MLCRKCLTSRTGDQLGAPCQTPGCDGVIEEEPNFSDLVDDLPEPIRCPRRNESPLADRTFPGPDRWQKFKAAHGNRVCSFCGSLHPDDMFALVKACAEAPADAAWNSVPEVDPSDKGYKIYVHQPGVRNAHEGAIKFYTQHLPRNAQGNIDIPEERHREYKAAVLASQRRFNVYLAMQRTPKHRTV